VTARLIEGLFVGVSTVAVINLTSAEAGVVYLAFIVGAMRADVYPSKGDK
jgi:hypothetical protein